MWQHASLALIIAVATACSGTPGKRATPSAEQGIEALVASLRSDDAKAAYALLAEDVQAQISFEEFAIYWNESTRERAEQARALETGLQGAQGDLGERARVVYSGGKSIHVARESGRWRLESATLSEVHSGRPQDAVRLLATALQGRDYRSVLRLLTKRRREGLDRQLDDFVRSLLEHLDSGDNTIEVLGDDRAELRWGDGDRRYKIVLRKEDNEWRIDDIHLRPVPSKPDGEEPTR